MQYTLQIHQKDLKYTTTNGGRLQMAACFGPISRRVKSDAGAVPETDTAGVRIAPHFIVTKVTVQRYTTRAEFSVRAYFRAV